MTVLKCALTSDTHYGFDSQTHSIHEEFWSNLSKENIDVLFWAGDISSSDLVDFERSLRMARRYLPNAKIILVRGNHDLWQDAFYKTGKNAPLGVDPYSYYRFRKLSKSYKRPLSFEELTLKQEKVMNELGIIHLNGMLHELNDHAVVIGYDGWYNETNLNRLGTNDYKFLPELIQTAPAMIFLREKAEEDLERILSFNLEGKFVVGMTHVPPFTRDEPEVNFQANPIYNANPEHLRRLTKVCDMLLLGHSHDAKDLIFDGTRIINSGSDYNHPSYVIFEIES